MKKFLSHLLVFAVNFYALSYILGIAGMMLTIAVGSLDIVTALLIFLLSFFAALVYQLIRSKVDFASLGETVIGASKTDILNQEKRFSITRIPIFILVVLTLLISGNLFDGIGDGHVYAVGDVLVMLAFTYGLLNGIRRYFEEYSYMGLNSIVATLALYGFFRVLVTESEELGKVYLGLYLIQAALWLGLGLIYHRKRTTPVHAA